MNLLSIFTFGLSLMLMIIRISAQPAIEWENSLGATFWNLFSSCE